MFVRVAVRRCIVGTAQLTLRRTLATANTLALSRVRKPFSTHSVPPSTPTSKRVFDEILLYWKKWLALRFGVGVIVLCGTMYILSTESEAGMIRRAVKRFEDSTVDEWSEADTEAIIMRKELEDTLVDLFRGADSRSMYPVVVGASGTGKSTAARKAIRSIQGNKGVVYFMVPNIHTFSASLAQTIGYRPPRHLWDRALALVYGYERAEPTGPHPAQEPLATWLILESVLVKAAREYKRKHGLAPCLVLDAMDIVARDDEHVFRLVQNFAKMCADKRILRVVFVFSDGTALPLLESNSAVSRAKDALEVGDLTDAAAIAYLESAFHVSHERAQDLAQTITGGRLALLNKYGGEQVPAVDIWQKLHTKTSGELVELGIAPTHELFKVLLRCTRCKTDMAKTLLSTDTLGQLLRKNIISQHPDETYTFHSRHVEVFIRQKVEEQRRAEAKAEERRQKMEEHRRSRSWWERVWGPSSA